MSNFKGLILLVLIACGHISTAFSQDLILSAPPRESTEAGMKMYGPIAQHLSRILDVDVTYKHPENWMKYQHDMRNDKYDIVFDGPHFIAWREEHLGHEALVRLPGKLQFVLVTDTNRKTVNKVDDLIGKNICGISPPNLSTLSVLDYYRNPVRQPTIKGIKGGMKKVFRSLTEKNKKNCSAVVLRTTFYNKKLKPEQKEKIKTVYKSKAMPNQGVSVSRRVSYDLKLRIKKSLTIGEGVGSTKKLLKRFAGKAKSFIPVQEKEYAGYNNLLEGIIWGW